MSRDEASREEDVRYLFLRDDVLDFFEEQDIYDCLNCMIKDYIENRKLYLNYEPYLRVEFEFGYVYTTDVIHDVLAPRLFKSWMRKLGKLIGGEIVWVEKGVFPGGRIWYRYKDEGPRQKRFEERKVAKEQARLLLEGQTLLTQFIEGKTFEEVVKEVSKKASRSYKLRLKQKFG